MTLNPKQFMIYIDYEDTQTHLLSFYLAMEEYIARFLYKGEECFFMWQVEPSVICGRNQVIENELNVDYCRAHHIKIFRRKSGGGCVYADMSNVMLSYITGENNIDEAFNRYMAMLTKALQQLDIPAERNDHNDIMLGGHKISGNAIWHIPGRTIAHGTLLYDTDIENMMHAITPGKMKLRKNGVESVRQRIALLKDHTHITLDEIKGKLKSYICDKTIPLSPKDVEAISKIEQQYLSPEFIYSK